MQLYFTETSPFVRKVLVAARERGLEDRVETVFLRPSPMQPDPVLSEKNPLSKIPTLVLDDGAVLFDSALICEYLDTLGDAPKLVPERGGARWRVLRTQALASGVLDAGVLVFYERAHRPAERQWTNWLDGQRAKITQGLAALERELAATPTEGPTDLGAIAAACACGWLAFRQVVDLTATCPRLAAWHDAFARRPSMAATLPR